MKTAVFWVVTTCSLAEIDRSFRDAYSLYRQGDNDANALMKEAAVTFETPVHVYETTRHII
jgi:hypothetical protein